MLCGICSRNIADIVCVECTNDLCKSCVGIHLVKDPDNQKIVKYQEEYTRSNKTKYPLQREVRELLP